jgi:uncharacterized protein
MPHMRSRSRGCSPGSPFITVAVALAMTAVIGGALGGCKSGKMPAVSRDDASVHADAIDPGEVAARLDKQCVGGDLDACRNLGVMYAEGIGVAADQRRSTALFNQTCGAGHVSSCNHLALALAEGLGVDKDPARAAAVYQQACDGGFLLACRNLGLMLRDGRGLPADPARAAKLLEAACAGKVPFACTNAGDLQILLGANGGVAHHKAAVELYKQGCEAGDPTGCRQIGVAYLEARGLPRSTTAAVVWLERACMGDDGPACRILGSMMMVGTGISRDLTRGQTLLERACAARDEEGCRLAALGQPAAHDAGTADTTPDSTTNAGTTGTGSALPAASARGDPAAPRP